MKHNLDTEASPAVIGGVYSGENGEGLREPLLESDQPSTSLRISFLRNHLRLFSGRLGDAKDTAVASMHARITAVEESRRPQHNNNTQSVQNTHNPVGLERTLVTDDAAQSSAREPRVGHKLLEEGRFFSSLQEPLSLAYQNNEVSSSPLLSECHLTMVQARRGLSASELATAAERIRDDQDPSDECSSPTRPKKNLQSLTPVCHQNDLEHSGEADATTDYHGQPNRVPLVAYFILTGAVMGLSSMGPLFAVQGGVNPALKTTWRNLASALFLFPLAAHSIYRDGSPKLTMIQWMNCILAPIFFSAMLISFSSALDYTTVGNVVILANSRTIILLMGRVLMAQPIEFIEIVGTAVALLGATVCSLQDDAAVHDSSPGKGPMWGDLLAIVSAIFGVLYMAFAKQVRPSLNLNVFMFLFMALASVQSFLYMKLTGVPITLDADVTHGIMGWVNLQPDRLATELALVFICSMMGTMGYIRSMQYFSNLVLCVAVLLQPLVAQLTALFLGVGVLPGWIWWMGNLLVIVGTLVVAQNPTTLNKYDTEHDAQPFNSDELEQPIDEHIDRIEISMPQQHPEQLS